jgi:hypothetical protein
VAEVKDLPEDMKEEDLRDSPYLNQVSSIHGQSLGTLDLKL